jgi:hypothetical protein
MSQLLVSSPWVEHFLSGRVEADESRPLELDSPVHLYRSARNRLAAVLRGAPPVDLPLLLRHPWTDSFFPLQALKALFAPPGGPPLFPHQLPSGAAPLQQGSVPRIAESCQMALLWALIGKKEPLYAHASQRLAGWLLPLLRRRFWSLWCRESEYNQAEARVSAALLFKACGSTEEADALFSPELPRDPFFSSLWFSDISIEPAETTCAEPLLGYRLYETARGACALSLLGEQTAAGALQMGPLQVPAFGPQTPPFADMRRFGVGSILSDRGWFQPVGQRETWFQMQCKPHESFFEWSWQQIGAPPGSSLFLSFFVIAETVEIDRKIFKNKSLQKFSGPLTQARFPAEGVVFQIDRPLECELIPLAGEGCFWGSSFLLAVSLPSFDTTFSFKFSFGD